ncbi:MAG: response regulator [Verrucomicrobiota bacterium]
MGKPSGILVLDDDQTVRLSLTAELSPRFSVAAVSNALEAEMLLKRGNFEILVCEDSLQDETGLMFMARIKNRFPKLKRILMSSTIDKDMLIYALNNANIIRVLEKPFQPRAVLDMAEELIPQYKNTEFSPLKKSFYEAITLVYERLPVLLLAIFVTAVTSLVLGSLVLVFLYFLKTVLGLNFFEDLHFQDLFPF